VLGAGSWVLGEASTLLLRAGRHWWMVKEGFLEEGQSQPDPEVRMGATWLG
jgi:hypothetical protein